MYARDGWRLQNGWIFGKIPNSLWPPLILGRSCCKVFFLQFYENSSVLKTPPVPKTDQERHCKTFANPCNVYFYQTIKHLNQQNLGHFGLYTELLMHTALVHWWPGWSHHFHKWWQNDYDNSRRKSLEQTILNIGILFDFQCHCVSKSNPIQCRCFND